MALRRQVQVTFDCTEPERVARFWAEVLGYQLAAPGDGSWGACTDPEGLGPRLYFQRVPEEKTVKNRVHLDVRVGDGLVGAERLAALEAERDRLIPLGAQQQRILPADEEDESVIVMLDIEGNEFCLD